ncbi:MAG TPA: hypothetical protein VMR95_04195 [Candidatus Binatia bacterium]|jgi:hypothetical protein|nr:hypothetical protein [Candidatus Binatia bacterium]
MTRKIKNRRPKAKAGAWFVSVRGSYLPASSAGWWTYIPFIAYLIFALVVGIKETSSIAIAILFIVPNWVAAAVIMTYLASKKS